MRSFRIGRLLVAAMLVAAVCLPAGGASAAPATESAVNIHIAYTSLGSGGGGIFQATPPLCAGGTDAFEFPSETLTCADGSGTFTIRYAGAPDERNRFTSWHFVGGTGAYAGIKGGGDVVSNTCPPAPCDVYLAGTVRL
jgi:hypothetical protein